MRWGLRSSKQQQQRGAHDPQQGDQERQQESKGKSKAIFSSFSPLAWLSKLTAKQNTAASPRPAHATTMSVAKSTTAHHQATTTTTASPSCFHKPPTTPTPASPSSASQRTSPPAASSSSSATAMTEIGPRRRSVGNDDTTVPDATAARQLLYRRHHYSVGGDRDLPPLGHLASLSRAASPKSLLPTPTPAPVRTLTPLLPPIPSDTDEEEKRPPRCRRRRNRRVVSGRRSFSSSNPKAPGGGGGGTRVAPAVRVRSPRPSSAAAAAVCELERFAVVRRTRDPQREFRASMVEMIASKRMVGQPQELETLLACYLSLNADEHHDCIVKVFRQVWFDLNNNNTSHPAAAATPPAAAAHLRS